MAGNVCPVCGEWASSIAAHNCPGRRTVPLLVNPVDWGLNGLGRLNALSAINEQTRSALQPSGVLLYPGSGDDVANALFAAYNRVQTFVFVDNWQGPGASASLEEIARTFHSKFPSITLPKRLNDWGIVGLGKGLGIRLTVSKMIAFEFSFRLEKRYLLFIRQSVEGFLAENPGFLCTVFFVKDFAGTSSDITYEMALPHLAMNGLHVSNALTDSDVPFAPLYGLRFVMRTAMVGFAEMFVYQKVRGLGGPTLAGRKRSIADAMEVASDYFSEADDTYDLLHASYPEIKEQEVEILAGALERVRQVLQHQAPSNNALYEMCVACVRKNAWIAQWGDRCPALNEPIYQSAWKRTWIEMIRSRPRPPQRRLPTRTPFK